MAIQAYIRSFSILLLTLACSIRSQAQSIITTIAGDGITEFIGDGGPATLAELAMPAGLYVTPAGVIYIADLANNRVRQIDASGNIHTFAGDSTIGYGGDNGPAIHAHLHNPNGVAMDDAGNLYISDRLNDVIRKVDPSGTITTVCGTTAGGYFGDNGPATLAHLETPGGVWANTAGDLFIPDYGNSRVRRVQASTGIITTIAGDGTFGYGGDNNLAVNAQLRYPTAVCTDASGNVYIADYGNHCIRKIDAITGIITTICGNGTLGYTGDNGPAVNAQLSYPNSIFVDAANNIFISDNGNNVIRMIKADGVIHTIVGTGVHGYSGDNGPAILAKINGPTAVFEDGTGNLYLADSYNAVIRKVTPPFLDVHNTTQSAIVHIFPNPSSGRFSIQLNELSNDDRIDIYNTLGQRVYTATLSNKRTDIDLSSEATDIYYISVISSAHTTNEKLIIKH